MGKSATFGTHQYFGTHNLLRSTACCEGMWGGGESAGQVRKAWAVSWGGKLSSEG